MRARAQEHMHRTCVGAPAIGRVDDWRPLRMNALVLVDHIFHPCAPACLHRLVSIEPAASPKHGQRAFDACSLTSFVFSHARAALCWTRSSSPLAVAVRPPAERPLQRRRRALPRPPLRQRRCASLLLRLSLPFVCM